MNAKKPADYYRDKVYSLTNLPTVPVIATEILKITRQDNYSVGQLLPIIEKDPPLALKILQIVNSAYYGMRYKVDSLQQAIVIIGMKELSHLVLGFSVIKIFKSNSQVDQMLEWQKLWEHSATCGHVAQLLVNMLNIQIKTSPYSLGLLHDVGKLVLFRLEPEQYLKTIQYAHENHISAREAEMEMFGVDHGQTGRWLAEKWDLPETIADTIGFHHNPELVDDPERQLYCSLIQLANLVCNLKSVKFGGDYVQSIPRDEAGWKILQDRYSDLRNLDFERFVMSIDDEFENIQKMVELTQE